MGVAELAGPALAFLLDDCQIVTDDPVGEVGVAEIRRVGHADVLVGDQTLHIPETVVASGEEKEGNAVGVQGGTAAPNAVRHHGAVGGGNSLFNLPPMDHVVADQMSPGNVAPIAALHILLEEQVIDAVVIQGRVGFIHPELVWSAVVLRLLDVAGQNILEADFLIGDLGHRDGSVSLGNFLGGKGTAVELELVHQAGMDVDEGSRPVLGLAAPADQQSCIGGGNGRTLGHFPAGQQLTIEIQGHGACFSVEGGGDLVPGTFGQPLALVAPKGNPILSGADLEGETAVALVSQDKALFAALAELGHKAGQQFGAVVYSVGVVPLKSAGCNPDADGQAGSLHRQVLFVVGDIGGVAVKEQAAALDAAVPPLGVLGIHVDSVGVEIVQFRVGHLPGTVGDGGAAALIERQMQKQIFFCPAAPGQQEPRRCCRQQQGNPLIPFHTRRYSFLSGVFPPWVTFHLNKLLFDLKYRVQLPVEQQFTDQQNKP